MFNFWIHYAMFENELCNIEEILGERGLLCAAPLKYRPTALSVTLDTQRYPALIVIPNGMFDYVAIDNLNYTIKRFNNSIADMVLLPKRLSLVASDIEEELNNSGDTYGLTDILTVIRRHATLYDGMTNRAKKAQYRKTGLSDICAYVAGKLYKVNSTLSEFIRITKDVPSVRYFESRQHLAKVFAPIPKSRVHIDNPLFDPHVPISIQHLQPSTIKRPLSIPNDYQYRKLIMRHGGYLVDWHEPSWRFFGCQKLMEIMVDDALAEAADEFDLLVRINVHVEKYSRLIEEYAHHKNLPMCENKLKWFTVYNKTTALLNI